MADVEILYLAWNRREFTGLSWHLLMQNTDWSLVRRLTVYDDGSEDGTLEFLREAVAKAPVECELRESDLRSPPAIMNHFLETKRDVYFAKLDNDICVPPGWLNALRDVMEAEPALELLGCEAGQAPADEYGPPYRWEPCSHIGGVGLMRTKAFKVRPSIPFRGRFGFTEWQERFNVCRGWIAPDLMMPQLDRVPTEPWISYSRQYVDNGWQRVISQPYPSSYAYVYDWVQELRG